jgi:hypothetical protein
MHLWGYGRNDHPTDSVQGGRRKLFSVAQITIKNLFSHAELDSTASWRALHKTRNKFFSAPVACRKNLPRPWPLG